MSITKFHQATTYPAIVGGVLKHRRQQAELDQSRLAEAAGVQQSTWSRVERGEISINVEQLAKVADTLHCVPSQILQDADNVAKRLPDMGVAVSQERVEDPLKAGLLLIGAAALIGLVILILSKKK